jgi:L-ascorbate oxidase
LKLSDDVVSLQDIINLDNAGKLKRNLINPPFKDTIQIPSGGYTIIRFHAINPGYWV